MDLRECIIIGVKWSHMTEEIGVCMCEGPQPLLHAPHCILLIQKLLHALFYRITIVARYRVPGAVQDFRFHRIECMFQ